MQLNGTGYTGQTDRPMTLRVSLSIVTMLCAFTGTGKTAQDDRRQAAALWERAVTAKGGRDRLATIRSFAIRETASRIRPVGGVAGGKVDQIVCELPHGWWEFLDYRPGEMGYSVRVANAATGTGWASQSGAPATPFLRPDGFAAFRIRLLQLVYFLETRSVRPAPISTTTVRLRSKTVNRVVVEVDGDTVDFYLDGTTNLPVRVEAVRKTTLKPPHLEASTPTSQKFIQDLEDYHEVAGIQVPATIIRGNDRFDVDEM